MLEATFKDKILLVDILLNSFINNKSVNYIVKRDSTRKERIKLLVGYSFEICKRFGKVFVTNDRKACAFILLPEKRKTTLFALYLDIKLIFFCIGLNNLGRVLLRNLKIKQKQIKVKGYYIWFIGVYPNEQHKGIGSRLLNELIEDAQREQRTVYLETSTLENIPWYKKFGFIIYDQLHLGYRLFFLKK